MKIYLSSKTDRTMASCLRAVARCQRLLSWQVRQACREWQFDQSSELHLYHWVVQFKCRRRPVQPVDLPGSTHGSSEEAYRPSQEANNKSASPAILRAELDPEDFLTFVELDEFIDDWKSLQLDVEQDLWTLQLLIMADPKGPSVIEGTGGLRKIRFAPTRWNVGKSHAARVCYVYFEAFALTLLVTAYDHNEKDNLSAAEKKGISRYIRECEKWLESGR